MKQGTLEELKRPAPYQPGAPLWTHPHIAGEMLKAHLNPDTDAASYRPECIDAICNHLYRTMNLQPGDRVADLGCGPGLYCRRLADRGLRMIGLEQSENSLRYARTLCAGQGVVFRQGSYLEAFGENELEAAILVSQDYGVLMPQQRICLLQNIHAALTDGGCFALDVSTVAAYQARLQEPPANWETSDGGFWRATPYVLLHAVHPYPEQPALCDLYAVLTDAEETVYRIWQTYYTPDTLRGELLAAGFQVEAVWGGLDGKLWTEKSPVMGALCRKKA